MTATDLSVALAATAAAGAVFVLVLGGGASVRRRVAPLSRIPQAAGTGGGMTAAGPHKPAGALSRYAQILLDRSSRMGPTRPVSYAMSIGVVAAVLIALMTTPLWGFAAIAAGGLGGLLWRRGRARSRAARLRPQVGEALDLIAATVKSGFGFVQAIELASHELSEPIAGELQLALREIELGVPVDDALRSLAERVDDQDLSLAISALLIQRRVGGALYEILNNIAELIRDRARIEGEIRSLTAQARLSARVVGALPIALAGLMAVIQPAYIEVLFTDPLGRVLIAIGVMLEIIGFWAIARLARLEF